MVKSKSHKNLCRCCMHERLPGWLENMFILYVYPVVYHWADSWSMPAAASSAAALYGKREDLDTYISWLRSYVHHLYKQTQVLTGQLKDGAHELSHGDPNDISPCGMSHQITVSHIPQANNNLYNNCHCWNKKLLIDEKGRSSANTIIGIDDRYILDS